MNRRFLLRLVPALVLAGPVAVRATHEVDHRYWVWGEVTYEDGTPAADVEVRFTGGDGKSLGGTKTNRQGRYRVVFHVHNPDLGKVFDMHVADESRKVKIRFNPADRSSERGSREDFVIGRAQP